MAKYNKMNSHVLVLAFLISLGGISINSMVNPVLPLITTELNITQVQSSLLVVSVPVIGIISSPVVGLLIDRFHIKRAVIISLLLLTGVGGSICAASTNYYMLLGLRIMQGVGSNLIGMSFLLISDMFHDDILKRKRWMSVNSAVITIGLAICPIIGGLLGNYSWRYSYVPFAFNVLTAIACFITLPFDKCGGAGNAADRPSFKQQLMWLKESVATVNGFFIYATTIVTFVMIYMVPLFSFPFIMTARLAATPIIISGFLCLGAFITAVFSFLYGQFPSKIPFEAIAIGGLIFMSGSFLVLAWADMYILIGFSMTLYGIGDFMAMTPVQANIMELAKVPQVKGTLSTLWVTASRIGQVIGPLVAAFIRASTNDLTVCIVTSYVGGISALLFIAMFIIRAVRS